VAYGSYARVLLLPILYELEKLNEQVLDGNYRLKALRAEIRQARARVAEAKASGKPMLTGGVNATLYTREAGSHDPLSAELQLEIPLFEGGRVKAKTARARAGVMEKRAEFQALELSLRQRVTECWLELQNLKVKQQSLRASADYREPNLDRSRSLYEMEVKADLGNSMVLISQQRLDEAQLRFRAELIWAELDALAGRVLNTEK
jgi:outer membrane protein TolC